MLNFAAGSLTQASVSSGGSQTSAPIAYALGCQKCLSVLGWRAHLSRPHAACTVSPVFSPCCSLVTYTLGSQRCLSIRGLPTSAGPTPPAPSALCSALVAGRSRTPCDSTVCGVPTPADPMPPAPSAPAPAAAASQALVTCAPAVAAVWMAFAVGQALLPRTSQ